MKKTTTIILGVLILLAMGAIPAVMAKVTPEEAERLKTDLTPFGAERAANADGTIPAWDGGISAPPQGLEYKGPGHRYPDPYADDKPLFSITAKNMGQYPDKLMEGQKALFRKYPDTYRIDVYPSRRPHAMPQWVYDNTLKNATRAESSDDGTVLSGAYGGIPFPIPTKGVEIMWNHLLRWQGDAYQYSYNSSIVQSNGDLDMTSGGTATAKFPYYQKAGSLEAYNGDYWYFMEDLQEPENKKGEVLIIRDHLDTIAHPRKSWMYLPGQRRVRKMPPIAYDTPSSTGMAHYTFDDAYGFSGAMDRFDWKLIGKKEMYIPYNCYKAMEQVDVKKIFHTKNPNPDYIRWELHRVWVVEATLKKGKRHIYERAVYLIDEDSWINVLNDKYDGRGNLWRTRIFLTYHAYDLPGIVQATWIMKDLRKDEYAIQAVQNQESDFTLFGNPKPDSFFTPDQISRQGKR